MKRKLAAASMGIALGTGGCTGRGLYSDVAVKLAPPATSRADVKALFGKPSVIAPMPVGACIEEWRYFGATDEATPSLVVRFDRAGKLCSWTAAPQHAAASNDGS